jgi:hypothetical protein
MTEPFARERILASQFAEQCPLPEGKLEALARLLSAYREELVQAWKVRESKLSKRAQ